MAIAPKKERDNAQEMPDRYSHLAPDTVCAAAMSVQGILDKKQTKAIAFAKG